MPNLNEYLGSIMTSITNARVISDLQTTKIAEQYANHQFLQHFSVPRMRIDDIEMTIPVGINSMNVQSDVQLEPIQKDPLTTSIYNTVVNTLKLSITNTDVKTKFLNAIQSQISEFVNKVEITNYNDLVSLYSDTISEKCYILATENNLITKTIKLRVTAESMALSLQKIMHEAIVVTKKESSIENLNVIVEASKLKEFAPESLVYIKVKISEEGMEWNNSENSKGEIISKLLPE
ncbi:conserved hypothetical protein [Flavobacterium sp. 9AF]|uniref:hypothetical protein n=1 Tax=Flavobacterium sp. 9AF TaxID=2653142 RepID=UPI0012EF02AA|nr:hypothetical protein [Flavobacterium sp. 9AF]VXB83601.1 conserved hypothetical protein [Flavobacterium sp. 9AF]